jgi:hypothetical protein
MWLICDGEAVWHYYALKEIYLDSCLHGDLGDSFMFAVQKTHMM